MNDIATQRRGWYSGKKLVLWTSIVAVELVLVGCWVGFYVAVVIAGSVASIAVMRRILGLWAAYLTAIPIGAVSFLANHSGDFWSMVDRILPDYHDRKEWLRANGAEMDLCPHDRYHPRMRFLATTASTASDKLVASIAAPQSK